MPTKEIQPPPLPPRVENGGQHLHAKIGVSDGTHVSFRPTISRDGTPVIEITVASPGSKLAAYQKIHFVKGHKR